MSADPIRGLDARLDFDGDALVRAHPPHRGQRLPRATSLAVGAAVAVLYAVQVARWTFLVDDAYISFRYARNLADGVGLVWNEAERVEGYTNFLWVVLVAAGLRLGLPADEVALGLGAVAGLVVLLSVAAFAARPSAPGAASGASAPSPARRTGWDDPWIWAAPALLVAVRPFPAWASGGLETMVFTALVTGGLTRFVVERESGWSPVGSALLLSLATLTRPDGALFLALAGAALAWESPRRLPAFAAPALLVVGHTAFRLVYYGWLLPNTFYAKVDAPDWHQGLAYLDLFHRDTGLGWFLVPALAGALLRRQRADVLFGAAIALYVAYVARVGGDIFEFRMLVPVLPLGIWLLTDLPRSLPRPRLVLAATLVAAALLADLRARETQGAPVRQGVASLRTMRTYTTQRLAQGRRLAELVEQGLLPPDLRIATAGAGALPYVADLHTTDVLGLNDATVAHEAPPRPGARLGHERRAWRGHLSDRSVEMLDVAGGFVFPGRAPSRTEKARADRRLAKFNRTPGYEWLVLRCRRVPGGHLLFASSMADPTFEDRFGHLPPCDGGAVPGRASGA